MKHTPTEEQLLILDGFAKGQNMVIEALAGAAKTSSLCMLSHSSYKRGINIVFNKSTQVDAKAKFSTKTLCVTGHSLAFQAVGKYYSGRLEGVRITVDTVAKVIGVTDHIELSDNKPTIGTRQIARLALEAVKEFCNSGDDVLTWEHVPQINGLDDVEQAWVAEQIVPYAWNAWGDLIQFKGQLRFDPGIYMKIWSLQKPVLDYDYIFTDEAQDTAPVLEAVLKRQQTQMVAVGDNFQSLYGWRGATNAMSSFGGERYFLTGSFRFNQVIADEANKWLRLLGSNILLQGKGSHGALESIDVPDAVLCRTNAGCVAEAAVLSLAGHSVGIMGGAAEVKRMAEAATQLKAGISTNHPDLFIFKNWKDVQEYVQSPDGADLKVFVKLVDTYGPQGIITIIDRLAKEDEATIIVSTVHKFKGKESNRVKIGTDFRENPGEREELMLNYVAVTRAKQVLDKTSLEWVDKLVGE